MIRVRVTLRVRVKVMRGGLGLGSGSHLELGFPSWGCSLASRHPGPGQGIDSELH